MVLQIADGDKLEVVEKLPTAKDARTCLFVPETGRIYLAVPRQEGKEGPEIRIYQNEAARRAGCLHSRLAVDFYCGLMKSTGVLRPARTSTVRVCSMGLPSSIQRTRTS